jgi:hypothetical protein
VTRAALAAVALAGCTVADVDLTGKQCPCASGWLCETATNTCVRDPAMIDARMIDAPPGGDAIDAPIDTPPGGSCLGTAPGAELLADDFADLVGWNVNGGLWSAVANEAQQTDVLADPAQLSPTGATGFTDYRVVVEMRYITGAVVDSLLAVGMRLQVGNSGQYQCSWDPVTGSFKLIWTRNSGAPGSTLAQTQVNLAAIPGYLPTMPVTIELQAVGNQLSCCLRDVPGATLTTSDVDLHFAAGSPTLRPALMSAAYRDFHVYAAP